MKAKLDLNSQDFDPLQHPAFLSKPKLWIPSRLEIWLFAIATSAVVFLLALGIQWLIYDRLLHQDGLRFVGSAIAAFMAMALVQHMKTAARRDRINEISRLEAIALVNHHVRNSLQAIAVCNSDPAAAAAIRDSVDRIERVLTEVLPSVQAAEKSNAAATKH